MESFLSRALAALTLILSKNVCLSLEHDWRVIHAILFIMASYPCSHEDVFFDVLATQEALQPMLSSQMSCRRQCAVTGTCVAGDDIAELHIRGTHIMVTRLRIYLMQFRALHRPPRTSNRGATCERSTWISRVVVREQNTNWLNLEHTA